MKLTVRVKLLPSQDQADSLKKTIEVFNSACNRLSCLAWGAREFRRFPMHRLFYRQIRNEFGLSANATEAAIGKVSGAYVHQKKQRIFRRLGSIPYSQRSVAINIEACRASLWSVDGRIKSIPLTIGEHHRNLLKHRKGEGRLINEGDKWFLNIYVTIPEVPTKPNSGWIGIDLGLVNIARSSDGQTFGDAKKLAGIRDRRWRQRKRLQSKNTRSSKRVMKRLSKRESRFSKHENHVVSKQIIGVAERTGRGIALENLQYIRNRIRASKQQRRVLHSWAFADLQAKITYKGRLVGVPVKFVDPRNSSRTCPDCGSVNKKNRASRDIFACISCGYTADADTNAAREISRRAAVNRPNEHEGMNGHVQNHGENSGD